MNTPATRIGQLLAWRPGGYLRSSGVLFAWLAVRTGAQTALFVLVARTLGAEGYGALISAMALAGIFSFAAMGASAVVVREGARDADRLPDLIRNLVMLWLVYMPLLSMLATVTTVLVLGDLLPTLAILSIVFAEVFCATIVDGIGRVYQSRDRVPMMGMVSSGLIIVRLITFLALAKLMHWTPETWAFGYLASSAMYTGLLILAAGSSWKPTPGSSRTLAQASKASAPFSFFYAAQKIQTEINKPMLARISDVAAAGSLSAAQRFTDLLLLPVLAMIETLAPRVYRAPNPIATAFTLGLIPLATAALGGGALVAVAHFVPVILGPSFAASIPVIMLLAGLPAVQVFRWLLGTAMTGLDLHRHFILVHGTGALTSIALVALLCPAFGLVGAVYAAYGTEAVLIVIQGLIILGEKQRLPWSGKFNGAAH